MKSHIDSFGYRFRPVDFMVRSSLVIALGAVAYFTFYGVFW